MSNAQGNASVDRMITKLRGLGEITRNAAPAVAENVDAAFKAQIARGQDAEGRAWPKTQEGKQALQTAGKHLVVVAVGSTVFARLAGHVARHNNGIARGGIERAIFPKSGLPDHLETAVRSGVTAAFREAMK